MPAPTAAELRASAEAALVAHGFAPDFPPTAAEEIARARRRREASSNTELADMRDVIWSSIDSRGTRDLDQVEFAEELEGGAIRLSIGVADVATHVPADSALDKHARTNTTTVYAGVAVFPMLPEELSADLTSLRESAERLAFVTRMTVARDGTVSDIELFRAVLCNHARLTFDEVSAWLDGGIALEKHAPRVPGLEEQLRLQVEVSARLIAARRQTGVIDADQVEPRPVMANGRIIDVAAPRSSRARDLIESFMVAANSAVGAWLEERGTPAIRRLVRTPHRWDRIVAIASEFGERLPSRPDPRALAAFMERRRAANPRSHPDLALTIVKLLGRGEYVADIPGRPDAPHFSLATAEYARSTAPNRRFPDLVTQRLIRYALGEIPAPYEAAEIESIARHCTQREDAARRVERMIRKKAAAAIMVDRIGESFPAIVTGASDKGTWARLLRPAVEGRISRGFEGLDVGDTVRVTLTSVDVERGYIDFESVPVERERKQERAKQKRSAAVRLESRIGEKFQGKVTALTGRGAWVRIESENADGLIIRGHRGLEPGNDVTVTLLTADPVHGFIDFENEAGVDRRKRVRLERKRDMAWRLRERIGETFEGEVSGVTDHATWVVVADPPLEGRIVRGWRGLGVGEKVKLVLLDTDAVLGFIDFARESGA